MGVVRCVCGGGGGGGGGDLIEKLRYFTYMMSIVKKDHEMILKF